MKLNKLFVEVIKIIDTKNLKGKCFAHRGVHDNKNGIPENSMLAFKTAIEKNTNIELDLHLLKDGKIVVFHDDNLHRMTGYSKDLKECTYDEIKNLKLLNTDEIIPLFEDILKLVDGKVSLDIEFKSDLPVGRLEEKACKYLDKYNGEFIVESFSPYSVNWFKKNRPNFIRGQLSCNFEDNETLNNFQKFIMKNMLLNFITRPDFIAYRLDSLPNRKVARYRRKGIPIFIWTIKSDEDLREAKKYGDSFIYENINIQ